ncbi:MAG: chitobiase/beta-hexosaminidase C-terminal domain-containing protein [Prolixibacteraceae bacterium]|nr:chitobiase/beta-hexosaminidase C-terminal domain-containing protein [Prolixibacteraceae bacterium]
MMIRNISTILLILISISALHAKDIFIAPNGLDAGIGTKTSPVETIYHALEIAKTYLGKEKVNIWLLEGTYHLKKTIEITSEYSGTKEFPLIISAYKNQKVVIKGSVLLTNKKWEVYKDGIYKTRLNSDLNFNQLFVNNERQIRARFPNYDYKNPLRGGKGYQFVTDGSNRRYDTWFGFDPEKFTKKEWENPETGIVHAFQSHNWGNMMYRIKSVDRKANKVLLGEGGWQLQRDHGIGTGRGSSSPFFVENIFEELDVPGEWFFDKKSSTLYYYPFKETDLETANIEIVVLKDLIQLKGSKNKPVQYITINGFEFTQSESTFMDKYEPLARGDWAIHRGGAVFMEGAENCTVSNCNFQYVGGNGVFVSKYNRNNKVVNSRFFHTGESGVCFVGSPEAVRWFVTWDDQDIYCKKWADMRNNMDLEAGPKTPDYPKDCVVENCLMYEIGDYGKQTSGVIISMSHKITVSHCDIFNTPRAGITINDGTWGGHIIEHNDIWETVRETGEHGPFNSWGRDRFWISGKGDGFMLKNQVLLDAIDPTIIRYNRISNFRKSLSAGNWTIDLDDGSSNYHIYNNLNLGSTLKLRDGYFRKVWNNIYISAVPIGWHCWPSESGDEFYNNITVIAGAVEGSKFPTLEYIKPARLPDAKMGENIDNNLYYNINKHNTRISKEFTLNAWQKTGNDVHSVFEDPLFIDPANGNYQVQKNSPALKVGFKNFDMTGFGNHFTQIQPYGSDFEESIEVTLLADSRAKKMKSTSVRFTLDGTIPTINSQEYKKPIRLNKSSYLKAATFNKQGRMIGFVIEAQFNKVKEKYIPSWYKTLLAGKFDGLIPEETEIPVFEWDGATLINIQDDPDLIDASGGVDFGCYIKVLDKQKAKKIINAGFKPYMTIRKLNGVTIYTIEDLERTLRQNRDKALNFECVYGYDTVEIKL